MHKSAQQMWDDAVLSSGGLLVARLQLLCAIFFLRHAAVGGLQIPVELETNQGEKLRVYLFFPF